MKPVSKTAQRVLDVLVSGLSDDFGDEDARHHRKIDNGGAGIMALGVEYIGPGMIAVAHRYEQNGDIMSDPEITYWRRPETGEWYPVTYEQHAVGLYQVAIVFDEKGKPTRENRRIQYDLVSFTTTWMRNIVDQQFAGKLPASLAAPVECA